MRHSICNRTNFQSQIGFNKNIEYSWSNNIDELVIQYYFQLIRGANNTTIIFQLRSLLRFFSDAGRMFDRGSDQFIMLYKLLGHTRDIINGKGECDLSYLQLSIWYNFFPNLAEYALNRFVSHLGSWKDIKKLCGYIKENCRELSSVPWENHPLIDYAISLMVLQLRNDVKIAKIYNGFPPKGSISLAGRWAPRQKSKYGWLFNKMAYKYYSHFFLSTKSAKKRHSARKKAKTHFRKLLSYLNRLLETPQIYMCNKEWAKIKFDYMTSGTLKKYQFTFQKDSNEDRIKCNQNFHRYIQKSVMLPTKNYEYEMVKRALCVKTEIDKTIINKQWNNRRFKNNNHKNVIALVDISAYMMDNDNIAIMSAIGIGLRISENNSIFKDCLLLFGECPEWICLEQCDTFVDKVQYIMQKIALVKGTSCQMYHAIKMIFDKIYSSFLPPSKINLQIFILSHMQVERKINSCLNTLFIDINNSFSCFFPPHIYFWNLYPTNGFPVISNQKNVTMISGYNGCLLKYILNRKNSILPDVLYTPEMGLQELLSHKRYDIFKTVITTVLK